MAYYLASSHSTNGAYVRWLTESPSSPLSDYIRLTGMPSKLTLGNVQLSIFGNINSNTPSNIFSEEETSSGEINIFPTPLGSVEDSFFNTEVVDENMVKLVVKDSLSFSSFILSPSEPSFFKGAI